MGWGICFGLDAQGRVYCRDGCSWRASASDYAKAGYPQWPSARAAVLDYFEGPAHCELDMIRDECPGTAAALAEACAEHIDTALGRYEGFSDENKQRLHESTLVSLAELVTSTQEDLKNALDHYKYQKAQWNEPPPRKRKAARTRADELRQEMQPLQAELAVEEAATRVDELRRQLAVAKRDRAMERRFALL
jgi:hypothetical protein